MNAETASHKHGAAREAAHGFEARLSPGDRVTARWRLLDIRVSAPATVLEVQDDCVHVCYGSEVTSGTTRWLPLSTAADWSPDHGVFPLLEQLWMRGSTAPASS